MQRLEGGERRFQRRCQASRSGTMLERYLHIRMTAKRDAVAARHSGRKARVFGKNGAPGGTRTPGLLIRSQSLYPAELQALRPILSSNRGDSILDGQARKTAARAWTGVSHGSAAGDLWCIYGMVQPARLTFD